MKQIYPLLLLLLFCVGCDHNDAARENTYLPAAPDYNDSALWYAHDNGKDVDVFYLLPTCIFDWTTTTTQQPCHHYDPQIGVMKENFDYSLQLAADIFGGDCNFYAPYYRQISLDSWLLDDSLIEQRYSIAQADVNAAFRHFLAHRNAGKDFILAGYSQGAKAVVELVKSLKPEELARMRAAYVIGYRVTPEDLRNPNLRPAQSATDLGVTICYNSVKTERDIWRAVSARNQFCINPVNWTTDATAASLPGDITVRIDTLHRVLLVDGYNNAGNTIPLLEGTLTEGNYHLSELTLYRKQLKENVKARAEK